MTIDFEPDTEAAPAAIDFEPDTEAAPAAIDFEPISAIKAAQSLAQMHDFEASGFPSRLAFENDEPSRLSRMREFGRAQKESGLSSDDLRVGMADAAALNFNRKFDNEGKKMRDDARVLSFGEVAANPQLSFDEGEWKSAIESTGATAEAKKRAIADRIKYRDDLGEYLYQAALSSGTFKDWLDAQKDSDKASAGELIERFRKEKGAASKAIMQAGSGVSAGVAGLGKGFYGLGEFLGISDLSDAIGITDPKNPSLATVAAENEKRASGISEALGGATFLNKVARGGVSLAPMVLAGGAASALGATEAAALNAGIAAQSGITAGGTFIDAQQAGLGPIESRLQGAYQAGVEATFTKLGGATGAEALLSQKAGASGVKNFAKNFAKGAVRETFLEGLPTTLYKAPSAARIEPNYSLADALVDTATVSAVLGGSMEGASGVSRANAAKALVSQAQDVGPATRAAVEALRPRRAPESAPAEVKPVVSESTKLQLAPKPEEQIYAPTNRDVIPSQVDSVPATESVPALPEAKTPVRLSAETDLQNAGEIDFEADVFEGVQPKPEKPEPYVEVYMPPINQFEIESPSDTFGSEGTLAGDVMDFGGVMSRSNGAKYGKVASQWDGQFVPAKLQHRKVFAAGKAAKGRALVENTDAKLLAGLTPTEMVDELIRSNKLPVGSTVNDLWAALQEESDSAARIQGQASAEVRNAKDSIREARKQAVDFKDAAMQKEGEPIRVRELSVGDTIEVSGEPLRVIAIDPETDDVTFEDGKRFGIQEVSAKSVIYGEIKDPDWSIDGTETTTPEQASKQGDSPVQERNAPEAAAETGAQVESPVQNEVAPAAVPVPKLRAGQKQGDLLAGTTEDAFNLAGETAIDGERVSREKAEKEKREADAKADFEKRQTNLFDAPKPDVAPSGLPIGTGKMTAGELPSPTKIGSYNAMVDKQRAERGLPPLMSEARKLDETTWDNAERAIEADETLPERLVDDILSGRKEQATDEEQAMLLWRMIDLRNRRDAAGIRMNDASLSVDEQNAQMNEFSFLEAQLQETESADRKIGTAQGRALRFRRVLANDDFTLAGIEAQLRRSKAEPLTPDEIAGAKADAENIAGIQGKADTNEDAVDESQSIEAAKALIAEASKYSPEVLRYAEKVVSKWEAEAVAAAQMIRDAMGFANAGANPKLIAAVFKIARAKLARKAISLADFTAEMVTKFGEGISTAVEPAYERAKKFITGLDASKVRKKSKRQLDRETAAGDQADATEAGIRDVVKKGAKFGDLSSEVKQLAREYIEAGVSTVEALEDKLHAFFSPMFAGITRRQLRDAFSDYGKSTPASTDPVKMTASRLRSEAQKLSQLEALIAKEAPLRTGQQRNPQSDRARSLQREINELKRKIGMTEGRSPEQLRTILDSMITRTGNRIKDLRFEIARGERLIRTKTAPPTSMKLEALREELAKVEAEHASLFPRAEMTEGQRLKVAITAAERARKAAAAELENAKKGIFAKPAVKGVARSVELEAIRQKTKAARLELAALKDAATPKNPEMDAAQEALNKALVSRERWDQLLKGELAVPGKKPGEALSEFEDDVRAEIAAMRQLAAEIKRDARPKTDPEIAKENAQVKALEKAAADYEARLNAGDFAKKGKVNGPDTARVAAAKALRDAAKKAYDAAVDAATPKLSPDQIKINVRKAAIQRQLAEIADREARGDYAKRTKKPKLDLSSDPEAVKLQAQLEKAKSDIARKMFEYEQSRRTRGQRVKDAIFETLRSERNLLGSMDVSAPRQGLGLILAHPVIGAKKLGKMFSALFSEKQALEMEAARNLRPNAQAGLYKKMKLALTPLGETTFSAAEENARSSVEKWADFDLGKGNVLTRAAKAPLKVIGKGVRISNRAYVTYLNELRADVADALLRINFHSAAPSDADLEAIGSMINTFSGRGLDRGAGQFASNILYSPQFLAARIKMLTGFHAWRPNSTADARKIAAKEQVRQLATWFVIMSLINALSDDKDEKEEGLSSSDTGKFVDGNTRIDYSGGSASLFVLGARLWNNVAASAKRGIEDDDKGAKKQAWDFPQEFYRQFRYKAAPWLGTAMDWAAGKPPLSDEPVTVTDSAKRLVMPMSWDGVSGLMEEHGVAKGALYQMQNLLGAGVKNYESKR